MDAAFRTATVFWRQRHTLPQFLIVFVTSRCNARCNFCLYWDQINDPVPKSQELTVDEVDRIAANYGPLNQLSLSGGEPFVRGDIADLCQPFIDRCGTKVIDIPSNFWFTDKMEAALDQLATRNPEVLVEVQLSLDHVGAAHDESRKVAGLYDRIGQTLTRLGPIRRRNPNLHIKASMVWLERNRDDIDAIATEVGASLDVDRIHVAYPNMVLPTEGDPEVAADITRFSEAASRVAETTPGAATDLYSVGIRASRTIQHRLLAKAADGTRPTGDFCEAGRWIVVIDERGEVFPCEPLWEPIGNLRDHDYDLRKVLDGPAYADFRHRRLGGGRCNCTWGCAMSTSVSTRARFVPELAANSVRVAWRDRQRPAAASDATDTTDTTDTTDATDTTDVPT